MWPASFWLYPMMPWLIATQLPAIFLSAWATPSEPVPPHSGTSAEIIPFPTRRAAAG